MQQGEAEESIIAVNATLAAEAEEEARQSAAAHGDHQQQPDDASPIAAKPPQTPLPKFKLLLCILLTLSDSFCFTLPFPFIPFMVDDFGIAGSTEQVGYFVGLLMSAVPLAQIFTSFFWGLASDKIGHKPIMLVSLFCNAAAMLAFGFSTNYYMAFACRFFNGMYVVICESEVKGCIALAFGAFFF